MLIINNLSKYFKNKRVLHTINLVVKPGEIAFLLGSSGVGKSTLLRILNGLEIASSGSVMLDNEPIDISKGTHNNSIGIVFQHFNLFEHLTIQDNITLALQKVQSLDKASSKQRALEFLTSYELADKAQCYPADLSGGQKQRVALARTLALHPRLICLDEPTSALDPSLTSQVARAIQQLAAQNYSVLIASHDVSLLQLLDCTVHLMKEGTIVQSCPSNKLNDTTHQNTIINEFVRGGSY